MKVEKCPSCDHEPRFFLDPRIPFDSWCADCNCFNVEWITATSLFWLKVKWNHWARRYERDYKRLERRARREAKRIAKEGKGK